MGISRLLKEKFEAFTEAERERITRMGWEDRTSYESIKLQFGLTPSELVRFMRYHLDFQGFKRWRKRIFEQGKLKNDPHKNYRFKSKSQRLDGSTKNHK